MPISSPAEATYSSAARSFKHSHMWIYVVSWLVAAVGFIFLLNLYDRNFTEPKDVYRTTGNTIWKHLTDSKWVIDNDQFSTNQFLHPYQGTIYYGFARSAGLNFWESFVYTAA